MRISTEPRRPSSAPTVPRGSFPRRKRIPGLDGLRAIAILSVFAFHLAPHALPGGFIGVDIFFVISGFLITTGLIRERARTGTIDLRTFWVKRARRLLPALVLAVTVCASVALVIGGDLLVRMDAQILGAMTFSSNWVSIAADDSYFGAMTPQLFSNLWSLAVEEQFYLLWPLLVLLIVAVRGSRRIGLAITAFLALASAGLMAYLYSPDVDPTRVYYGTDTHLFGLMLGAYLAFWYFGPRRDADGPAGPVSTGSALERHLAPFAAVMTYKRRHPGIVSSVSVVVLVVLMVVMPWDSPWTYRGGLLLASVTTALIISSFLRGGRLRVWLSARWIEWIGQRSYGLYLWHWPVFVLFTQIFAKQYLEGTGVTMVWGLTVAVTFVIAAASYRWLELPVQRLGFRRALGAARGWALRPAGLPVEDRDLGEQPAPGALARGRTALGRLTVRGQAALAGSAVLVAMTVLAMLLAPSVSAVEQQIEAGRERALASAPSTQPAAPSQKPSDAPTGEPSGEPSDSGDTESEATPGPTEEAPSPEPTSESSDDATDTPEESAEPVTGADMTIIGDSVTLASVPAIQEIFPDAAIDAEVSRSMLVAPSIIADLEKKDELRDVVVLSLATNTTLKASQLTTVLDAVGPDRDVILVNAYGNRNWIKPTNKVLADAAKENPRVVLADWAGAISTNGQDLAADGIHPTEAGGMIYAKALESAYEALPDR